MKQKGKFNKDMCKKCKFHGNITGVEMATIFCNYASLNEKTCLESDGIYTSKDRRGDDYDNCLLFEEGKKKRDSANWQENNMSGLRNLGGVK